MRDFAQYGDMVEEVAAELRQRIEVLADAGVEFDQIVLDPGLGISKTAAHNWKILRHLDVLRAPGRPLLIGASRKFFLEQLSAPADGGLRPVRERDVPSAVLTALGTVNGVWGVRVHNVSLTRDALQVAAAWKGHRVAGVR